MNAAGTRCAARSSIRDPAAAASMGSYFNRSILRSSHFHPRQIRPLSGRDRCTKAARHPVRRSAVEKPNDRHCRVLRFRRDRPSRCTAPSTVMTSRRFCVDGPRLARDNLACRMKVACSHVSDLLMQPTSPNLSPVVISFMDGSCPLIGSHQPALWHLDAARGPSTPGAVGTRVSSRAPRTEPHVRLSRMRLPPRVCDGKAIARPGM